MFAVYIDLKSAYNLVVRKKLYRILDDKKILTPVDI